jgi:diguanylate cyclase (GGDEF)-like protein
MARATLWRIVSTRSRPAPNELRAARPPAAFRDVEHWSDADKVLLGSALVLPFAYGWVARLTVLQHDPSASSYVDRAFLPILLPFTWFQAIGHTLLALVALWLRGRPARRLPWLVHAEIQLWFACMSFSLYAMGPFTSSYGVLWLALPITGFLLFDERPMRLGLLSGSIGTVLGVVLPALGVLPYAPFVGEPPFGHGRLQVAWLLAIGLPSCFATVVVLVVFVGLVRRLRRRQAELEILSSTDALTGLANRGTFFRRLDDELANARRHGYAVSVVMIDADHFKNINDTHGHVVGDRVLRELAALVSAALREGDVAARYGGEELAVLLPHTPLEGARVVAQRLVERARTVAFAGRTLSVSAGVAAVEPPEAADALVARADAAMYESKRSGRDRVTVASPTAQPAAAPTAEPTP